MSAPEQKNTCAEIAELFVFYVCDEVSEQERVAIEQHVAVCAECRARLKEEYEFHAALRSIHPAGQEPDSSGILLAQCRSELAEALDELDRPAAKPKISRLGFLRRWMALHPAWSAATLVLLGLVGGIESAQWLSGQRNAQALDQAVNVRPTQQLTEDQLSKMVVAGVNLSPSSDPSSKNVRVLLSAEQPVELTGNLDDSDVRQVLTYVVRNGDRFDPGVRLDCLDALRARADNGEVRSALLCAARRDPNPAVRLKALEALRVSAADSAVRDALLEALKHDANPGVRVEAVNLLVRSLEAAEQEVARMPDAPEMAGGNMVQAGGTNAELDGSLKNVIRTLGDLRRNDPSQYVRLRSAAALREISARSEQ